MSSRPVQRRSSVSRAEIGRKPTSSVDQLRMSVGGSKMPTTMMRLSAGVPSQKGWAMISSPTAMAEDLGLLALERDLDHAVGAVGLGQPAGGELGALSRSVCEANAPCRRSDSSSV